MYATLNLKNVKIDIAPIEDEYGNAAGCRLDFHPIDSEHIYFDSHQRVVRYFPKDAFVEMSMRQFYHLYGLLIEPLSSYLYSIRSQLLKTDLREEVRTSDGYGLKVRVSRFFFREETKGRHKILLTLFDEHGNDIVIGLTKRDVLLLVEALRKMFENYLNIGGMMLPMRYIDPETKETVAEVTGYLMKRDNSLLIDQAWLHGQELTSLMYVAHELLYHLHAEKNLGIIQTKYRQIHVEHRKGIVYVRVHKLNKNGEDDLPVYKSKPVEIELSIGQQALAMLYLNLSLTMLAIPEFEGEEILGHKRTTVAGEKTKYHMQLKESALAIVIKPNIKKGIDRVFLVGEIQTGLYSVTTESGVEVPDVVMVKNKEGEEVMQNLLPEFKVNLKDAWPRIIRGLSLAFTQEYREKGKDRMQTITFSYTSEPGIGLVKYEVIIQSSVENKMTVFRVNKYKMVKGSEPELIGTYRQPLTRKHVFQLLQIFLAVARDMQHMTYVSERNIKDMLPYMYRSFKQVQRRQRGKPVKYGIYRSEHGDVILGVLDESESEMKAILPRGDIVQINLSSRFRLLNARWIPFVGDFVSIGPDGYLTDMFGEINLEKEGGADWAARLYFGTAVE